VCFFIHASDNAPSPWKDVPAVNQFDRVFQLHRLLNGRRTGRSFEELQTELGCSRSSLRRAIVHPAIDPDQDFVGFSSSRRRPAHDWNPIEPVASTRYQGVN
jgi:hypothetical protein